MVFVETMHEMGTARSKLLHPNRTVLGPAPARPVRLRRLSRRDFPRSSSAHLDAAEKLTSPAMLGPPLCPELVDMVEHLFTEEEARVFRHLPMTGATARAVARAERRDEREVAAVLERLATVKWVIWSAGAGPTRRFGALPIVPGMFELMMVRQRIDALDDWHRTFLELFEALQRTGYTTAYTRHETPLVRFLPTHEAAARSASALPSDKLEVVFDRFDTFAVAQCQCRMARRATGEGCDRPLDNCMALGDWARSAIEMDLMQPISKAEAIAAKKEAEAAGCVTWILNVEGTTGQASCSCCGCCCHVMRWMTDYDAPALFAPPHFLPALDGERCRACGKCAKRCPMGAIVVDTRAKTWRHLPERCIGCGLCELACTKERALAMEPVPDYRLPPRSWLAFAARAAPGATKVALESILERRLGVSWW